MLCRPGGLTNASPQEVGNVYVGKEDTLFAGKESPGKSVSRETVSQLQSPVLVPIVGACSHALEMPHEATDSAEHSRGGGLYASRLHCQPSNPGLQFLQILPAEVQ